MLLLLVPSAVVAALRPKTDSRDGRDNREQEKTDENSHGRYKQCWRVEWMLVLDEDRGLTRNGFSELILLPNVRFLRKIAKKIMT